MGQIMSIDNKPKAEHNKVCQCNLGGTFVNTQQCVFSILFVKCLCFIVQLNRQNVTLNLHYMKGRE